jgi:uncharacterized protein (DUF1697 family)
VSTAPKAKDVPKKPNADNRGSVTYTAFLRGINVGGHKPTKMEDLKRAFESLGLRNVKTVLASGNVLFDPPSPSSHLRAGDIEDHLKKVFGHEVGVILRSVADLQRLADLDPFKGIPVTAETRLYVTFLAEQPRSTPVVPAEPRGKSFRILRTTKSEVLSVLTLSLNTGTTDLMNALEKSFGKSITTRNWNTVARILDSAQTA